jgi:hypothetical protein
VVDGYQRTKGTSASQSLFNEAEAEAALSIYKALQHRYPMLFTSTSTPVLNPNLVVRILQSLCSCGARSPDW